MRPNEAMQIGLKVHHDGEQHLLLSFVGDGGRVHTVFVPLHRAEQLADLIKLTTRHLEQIMMKRYAAQ